MSKYVLKEGKMVKVDEAGEFDMSSDDELLSFVKKLNLLMKSNKVRIMNYSTTGTVFELGKSFIKADDIEDNSPRISHSK